MIRRSIVTLVALVGCLASSQAAPAPKTTTKKGFETPQAVFKAAQAAQDKGDYKAFMACLTSDGQDIMAGAAVMMSSLFTSGLGGMGKDPNGTIKAKVEAALKKEGVTKETLEKIQKDMIKGGAGGNNTNAMYDAMRKAGKTIKDKPGFVGTLFEAMQKIQPQSNKLSKSELKDLKITKDRATAFIVSRTEAGPMGTTEHKEAVTFEKGKDGWKMGLGESKK